MPNTRSVLARRVHPMSSTRRQFLQSSTTIAAATSLVGMTAIFEVACSSTTALAEVERFEPVVINALTLACAINSGLPVCGSEQSKITADYNTVIQLWTDYNKAVAAGTSTVAIWNDLNAAFTVFEEDSSLIFAAATGLNAPELTAIVAAAQVLLAAIEAAFPPAPAGATKAMPVKFKSARQSNFNLGAWTKDYNNKVDIAHKLHPRVPLKKIRGRFFPL